MKTINYYDFANKIDTYHPLFEHSNGVNTKSIGFIPILKYSTRFIGYVVRLNNKTVIANETIESAIIKYNELTLPTRRVDDHET